MAMALSRATMTVAVAILSVAATAVTARITFRPTAGPSTPASSTAGPTASAGPTTPSQECWPYCPNNNTLLANPRNCSTFYSCTGNLDGILQACPSGLVFVPEEQGCDYPDVYSCTDDPDAPCATQPPTQPTTVEPEPTTNEPEPTTSEPKPTTNKPEPTTNEPEPTTNEPEPTRRTFFPPRSFARYGSDNDNDFLERRKRSVFHFGEDEDDESGENGGVLSRFKERFEEDKDEESSEEDSSEEDDDEESSEEDSSEEDNDEESGEGGDGEDSLPVCPDPVCTEENGLMANPSDCTSFYSCSNYAPHLLKCPKGLEFNNDQCDWPGNSDCTVTCVLALE